MVSSVVTTLNFPCDIHVILKVFNKLSLLTYLYPLSISTIKTPSFGNVALSAVLVCDVPSKK